MFELDLSKEIVKPRLYLAKPSREIIGELNESYNIKLKLRLGGTLNELSFEVPFDLIINQELKRNPNIDNILDRFLVKLEFGNHIEWFIIKSSQNIMSEESDSKKVVCLSQVYQLTDKTIRKYEAEAKNATEALTEALNETVWNVNYVDSEYNITRRDFDVNSVTVLQFIFDIANSFGGLLMFDTENKTVSLYNPDNIGTDKGLMVGYNQYLINAEHENKTEEAITQLDVYGKNNISIADVNITGENFLTDFSNFLFPFERDDQGNVLKSSKYMSDTLCHSILDFNEKLQSKQPIFNNLLSQKESQQYLLEIKQTELTTLNNQLEDILILLDSAQANEEDVTQLLIDKGNKQAEINSKQGEIDIVQGEINILDSQIADLRSELSIESNFTSQQIQELDNFIIKREIVNENIEDPKELLKFAEEEFDKVKISPILIKCGVVNFLECLSEQRNWDRLVLGDKLRCNIEKFNLDAMTKIIGMDFDFETGKIDLEISNVEEIKNKKQKFIEKLNKSINTSTKVNYNISKWNGAASTASEINQIINSKFNANKTMIVAGQNENYSLNERGLTLKSPTDPMNFLRGLHNVLAFTNDGGNTYKTALTPQGTVAENVFGTLLCGVNLKIDASDNEGNKTFSVDNTGVKINGLALTIENGLDTSQINGSDTFVLQDTLYNGIKIDTIDGLTVIRSDNKTRTIANATDGIKIQQTDGIGGWIDKLYADTNGSLTAEDLKTKRLIINDTNDNVLIDADTKKIDFSKFTTIVGDLTADNIDVGTINVDEITYQGKSLGNGANSYIQWDANGNATIKGNIIMDDGSISWADITAPSYSQITGSKPPTDAEANPSYIKSTKITATTIESPTITGGSITSNTNINVGTDLRVGKHIYLDEGSNEPKSIVLAGQESILFDGSGNLQVDARTSVAIQGVIFGGTFVDFKNRDILNFNANVTAVFG